LAQRLSFRLIVQGDSAVAPASAGLLLASVAAGTTAYAFYQLSGVFYFALTSITALAAADRNAATQAAKRYAVLFSLGAVAFILYGLLFIGMGGELHASSNTFSLGGWLEGLDLAGLGRSYFEAPWGALPRVMSPWSIVVVAFEIPYQIFAVVFFLASGSVSILWTHLSGHSAIFPEGVV
jgi:hypothetical protein